MSQLETFEKIKAMEDAFQLPTYAKYPIALEYGRGCLVRDSSGKEYLDMYGGHAVCLTGHCHPKVVSAIQEQLQKLLFYSNVVYNSTRASASDALLRLAPSGITQVFFCNSGAEANEAAIKLARKHTGKEIIVSMRGDFHGRTCGALSITGIEKYRKLPPFMPGVEFSDYGDFEQLEHLCTQNENRVAAIILEPIQSMSGVRIATPEYYLELRKFCSNKGIILIFDEVQTGFGRTGMPFFGDHYGIRPDLITCAKAIASGVPMGALFVAEELAQKVQLGDQGTTFGGGPIACAAAKATAEIILTEDLPGQAKELGSYLIKMLETVKPKGLKEVRGLGLLIGIEFDFEVKKLVPALLERGILTAGSEDPKTLRLLPPLVLEKSQCDFFVEQLVRTAKEL